MLYLKALLKHTFKYSARLWIAAQTDLEATLITELEKWAEKLQNTAVPCAFSAVTVHNAVFGTFYWTVARATETSIKTLRLAQFK